MISLQADPEAEAVRVLFRDVIPALLGHRLAPLALCNATVVSEFGRLASRLQLLDDKVVPQALLASRAGERPFAEPGRSNGLTKVFTSHASIGAKSSASRSSCEVPPELSTLCYELALASY